MGVKGFSAAATAFTLSAVLFAGCGGNTTLADLGPGTADPSCPTGTAIIGVTDGFLKRICGCTEPDGVVVPQPTQLTCTVPAGTVAHFYFIGTTLPVQVRSLGNPGFAPSPVLNGKAWFTRAHAVPLPAAGTYRFENTFQSGMTGQFLVTP